MTMYARSSSICLAARFLMVLLMLGLLVGGKPTQVSAEAAGTTYYVDKTNPACSDGTGSMGTQAVPFCSIFKGTGKAVNPGDMVYVLAGTYAETLFLQNSGADGAPIIIRANPGVTVTGNNNGGFIFSGKQYLVIDGFTIAQTQGIGIQAIDSDHITISNNRVHHVGTPNDPTKHFVGIALRNTSFSTVTGNITDHNTRTGIRLIDTSDHNLVINNISFANVELNPRAASGIDVIGSSYNVLKNNIAYGNEDSGISIYWDQPTGVQSTNNVSVNNLLYGNGDHGIDHNNSPFNAVISNTIHGNGTVGVNFEGEPDTGSHHGTVINNIIVSNGFTPVTGASGGNMRVDSASIEAMVLDYNIYNRASASVDIIWSGVSYASLANFRTAVPAQEAHGIEADPQFVAPIAPVLRSDSAPFLGSDVTGDYHMKSSSKAIDSANSNAPSQPDTDLYGAPKVDNPDIANTGAGKRLFDDRGAIEYLVLRKLYMPTVRK